MSSRRRGRWRRRLLRFGLWVGAGIALLLFFSVVTVRSERAKEQLRVYLEDELSRRSERQVTVERVGYSLLPPVLELEGLTLPGPGPSDPDVLTVEGLRIEASLLDLWRRNWRLRQVEVSRPRIVLEVGPDGEVNLPRWKAPRGGQGLDLGTLVVEEGVLVVNDMEVSIDLAARDVRARLLGDGPNAFQGQLSAQALRLTLPGAEPIELDVVANGRIDAGGLELSAVTVRGPEVSAEAQGRISWAPPPGEAEAPESPRVNVALRVAGEGRLEALSRLGYLSGELSGPITTAGRLSWVGGEWAYRANVRSPRLRWLDFDVEDLAGEVRLRDRELSVEIEGGRYAGGSLSGRILADFEAGDLPIEADVRFVDVVADRLMADRGLPLRGFASLLDGEIAYLSLRQDRRRGSGWGQIFVRPGKGGEAEETLSWEGEIPFTIEAGRISSQAVLLRAPGQQLLVGGEYDLRRRAGAFDFEVDTVAAGPLARLLLPYLGRDPEAAWVPLEGHGQGSARLSLESSGAASVDLRVDLEDVRTAELFADRVGGRARATGSGVEALHLELDRLDGALLVTGEVRAEEEKTFAVDLAFDAVRWPLAEVRSFRDLELPLTGEASGRLSLTGPAREVRGAFEGRVGSAELGGLSLGRVAADLSWDEAEVRLHRIEARAAAGTAAVRGTIDRQDGSLRLTTSAEELRLGEPPLAGFTRDRLAGRVSFEGTVIGTAQRPRAEIVSRVSGLEVGGRSLAPVREAGSGEEGPPSTLRLAWDGGELTADGRLPGLGSFRGGGILERGVAEGESAKPGALDLRFAVESSELRALTELASGRSIPSLSGRLAGEVTVSGSLERPEDLRWAFALDHLGGRLGGLGFEQLEPVRGTLQQKRLWLDSVYLGEGTTGSEIFAHGEVDFRREPAYDVDVQGSTAVRWLLPLVEGVTLPPEVRLEGRFDVLGRIVGRLEAPRFDGQGELRLEPFAAPLLPQAVEDLVAQVSFYPDRLELERLAVDVGTGEITARGRVELPANGDALSEYRFYAVAEDLKLLIPEGWLQEGSAELWLTSRDGRRELEGAVELSQSRYLEDVDVGLAQVVERLLERERQDVGSTDEWLTGTLLNLTVEAPDALRVRNRAASLRGDLDLEVRGTLARPVLLGKVDLQPGGTLRYADNEYRLERGLVTFNNPYVSEPVLDLVATSRVRSYEVSLSLSGTPERLDLSVSSDPPLPELDVMALVTGGRPLEVGARPSLPGSRDDGQLNAEAFLYGQAASAITDRVNTLFGFDKFRVDPLSDGSENVSSVRVTVGKRLSKDLFVTYSRDPSTTEQDILEAEWQINPLLTLVFTQNGDGSFSVDALWDRRF